MSRPFIIAAFFLLAPLLFLGCRGYTSEKPPIHLNPNMDHQKKGRSYRASDFFDDGQYMRQPIDGTVSRGHLKDDEHFNFGKENGEVAKSFPSHLVMDEAFIKRGQQVFNRVCAACHGMSANGDGLVGRRLLVKPTSLHSDYLYNMPPGHYFDVIKHGIRTMKGLGHMINDADAWAVTFYARSLQMSQDRDGPWIERSKAWWKQK